MGWTVESVRTWLEQWRPLADWFVAIGTLALALVVFLAPIATWWRRPRFTLRIKNARPDCVVYPLLNNSGQPRRCPRLSPLWRPAAGHRHRAGSPGCAGHPRPPCLLGRPRAAWPGPARPGPDRVDSPLGQTREASLWPRPHRGPAAAPLRPLLDREPAAAQDNSGSAGDRGTDARLRSLEWAVPGPAPGFAGGRRREAGPGRPRAAPAEVALMVPIRFLPLFRLGRRMCTGRGRGHPRMDGTQSIVSGPVSYGCECGKLARIARRNS
jgi:hypothetical protein